MSIVDKVIETLTPPESDQDRQDATQKARAHCHPGDWLSQILDHHALIKEQFAAIKQARSPADQRRAEEQLGVLLTAHSLAEEAAIYPLIAAIGDTGHSTMAYAQQSAAKMQMGLLERLEPMSEDYKDKLGHIGRRPAPRVRRGRNVVHRHRSPGVAGRATAGHASLPRRIHALHGWRTHRRRT